MTSNTVLKTPSSLSPPPVPSLSTTRSGKLFKRPPLWISVWFVLSSILVIWDSTYVFFRPRSMPGGDLHWIWSPYELYGTIDYYYGLEAWTTRNGFTAAQSTMNVIETVLNFEYLYLAHTSAYGSAKICHPTAPLVGFAAAIMTLSKTLLYWLQDYFCDNCSVDHTDPWISFWVFLVPNFMWLLFPFLIVNSLGSAIAQALRINVREIIEEQERINVALARQPDETDLQDRLEPLEVFIHSDRHVDLVDVNEDDEGEDNQSESGENEEATQDTTEDEDKEEEEEDEIVVASPTKAKVQANFPAIEPVTKRGPGRPRKSIAANVNVEPPSNINTVDNTETPSKRGRGRPRKSVSTASVNVHAVKPEPKTALSEASSLVESLAESLATNSPATRKARGLRRQTRSMSKTSS